MPGPHLVEPLKALLQKLGPGTTETAVCIPSQLALVRRIPMPKVSPKRLRALIESQGQRFIPFYRDGANFDLLVINPNLNQHEQEVLLVAVPSAVIKRLQALLKTAGLRLVAVDVDTMALYRAALALGHLKPGAPAAVLDVGHRRARLGLFTGGLPSVGRNLDMLPLPVTPPDDLPDASYQGTEEFAVEVRRTLEVIQGQARVDDLSHLVLSAPNAQESLSGVLRAELQTGGRVASDFGVTALGTADLPADMVPAFGASLAVAVKPYRFTLLPRTSTDVLRQRRTAALLLLVALAGSGGYGYFWYQQRLALEAEQQRITSQIAAHNAYLVREKEIAALEARFQSFQPIIEERGKLLQWTYLYPRLRALLPEDVTISNVAYGGDSLSITGRSGSPEGLAQFIQRLEDSPLAAPPVLSTFTDPGGDFAISAKVTPMGGGAR